MCNMKKGMFITFEGLDGSGKSTQVALLKDYLVKSNIDHLVTKEPTDDNQLGKYVRDIVLNNSTDTLTEFLLFIADRNNHLITKVRPALEAGKIVVCDRFADSTLAYQITKLIPIYGKQAILSIANTVVGDTLPDLTIFLDTHPTDCMKRIQVKLKDSIEQKPIEYFESVYEAFLKIANANKRVVVIPEKDVAGTHHLVIRAFNNALKHYQGVRFDDKEGLIPPLVDKNNESLNNVLLPEGMSL